ncbi:MAG: hypothetical protein ABIZ09_01180 [Rhodoferax sp.]|jgi:hypothetical protein
MNSGAIKPYWTHPDDSFAWYRVHIHDRNYSVKVVESPFEEDVAITEIKQEWSGGKTASRKIEAGEEYEKVSAAYFAARKAQ